MYQLVQTFLRQWKNGSCHFDIFMLKTDWLSHIKMIQLNILQIITNNTRVCLTVWASLIRNGCSSTRATWLHSCVTHSAVSLSFSPCCLFFKCVRPPLFWICDSRCCCPVQILCVTGSSFSSLHFYAVLYIHTDTRIHTHTCIYTCTADLNWDLPDKVACRNHIQSHWTLGGPKPASF